MKILILSDDFPPQSFGGAGYSTFYLASGLQKAGHQVYVITAIRNKKEQGGINYQGLNVFRIYSKYHQRWRAYLSLYNPQTIGKVRELIKEIKPDIIHAHNIHYHLSYYCLKIAKKHSKAIFFTARDAMSFYYGKMATERYLKNFDCRVNWLDHLKQARKRYNPLRNFLIRRYLKYPDKLFSVSNALKNALEENGIKNVEISHTGIDVNNWQVNHELAQEFKKKHNLENKKVVFFGGRLNELKGGKKIIQAMKMVIGLIPEAVLLVAGKKEGYVQEQMLGLAQELGIRDSIVLTGWLNSDELKLAYYSSNLAVVPSIYLDPFPRMNLEAMTCKKPVISTCYGGSSEIVQDGVTGYIINPLNVELIAEKILDLLKNPQKAEQFGQAGYQRIKQYFSLKKHVQDTLSWYRKIIDFKQD